MSPSPRLSTVGLSDPELRLYLARYLHRRLPAADADDALQAVYCAALEARALPDDASELRRFLTVIARRKVAAHYERAASEQLGDPPEQPVPPPPVEALSLLRWAERQAAESQVEHVAETLDWMARESEGEKLEAIAAEAAVPSTRVRQRVFRLRRFMKVRWALEISAALLALLVVWWLWSRRTEQMAKPAPAPSMSVIQPSAPSPAVEDSAPALEEPPKPPPVKPTPKSPTPKTKSSKPAPAKKGAPSTGASTPF